MRSLIRLTTPFHPMSSISSATMVVKPTRASVSSSHETRMLDGRASKPCGTRHLRDHPPSVNRGVAQQALLSCEVEVVLSQPSE